jgi:hypothetical protein
VLAYISHGSKQPLYVMLEIANPRIASMAQDAANLSTVMAMVRMPTSISGLITSAYGAEVALGSKQSIPLVFSYIVPVS